MHSALKKRTTTIKRQGTIHTGSAHAPGHITGFFEIHDTDADPLRRGSRGAGISLDQGVTTGVSIDWNAPQAVSVTINDRPVLDAAVSRRVIDLFFSAIGQQATGAVNVRHVIEIPQGAGFGSSGAGALSLAYALNRAFGDPLSQSAAGGIAHRAEVACGTGLGTVLADTVGGLEIRVRPGAPGIGEVRSFPINDDARIICIVFGPLSTRGSLRDPVLRNKINSLGGTLVDRLLSRPDPAAFMHGAREFAEAVGLIGPKLRPLLDAFDAARFPASMPMFGEALFCLCGKSDRDRLAEIITAAKKTGAEIYEFKTAPRGGHVCDAP